MPPRLLELWALDQVLELVILEKEPGVSLVVQRLGYHVSSTEDLGSISSRGIRSPMPHLKIQHASAKIQCTQIDKNNFFKKGTKDLSGANETLGLRGRIPRTSVSEEH